jgi:hypothetical protein
LALIPEKFDKNTTVHHQPFLHGHPYSNNFDNLLIVKNLIDQAMLYAYGP